MKKFISDPRLNSYKSLLKLKTDEEALRAYYWNKALSGALYPALQALEITLRNGLNEAVKSDQSSTYKKDDWWFEHIVKDVQNRKIHKMSYDNKKRWLKTDKHGSFRLDNNGLVIRKKHSYYEQQILKSQGDLKKEGRTPIIHDDVLSRLMFGFWTGLLGDDFEDVTNKSLLWPNLLTVVFPNTPYKPKRIKIEKALTRIKDLRNRLSHHEPIWKFYQLTLKGENDWTKPIGGLEPSINLLNKSYDSILEFIRWISQERYDTFINARLDVEFRKLCSIDGFYSYVDSSKVKNTIRCSRFKREATKHINAIQKGNSDIIAVTKANKTQFILGINEPSTV